MSELKALPTNAQIDRLYVEASSGDYTVERQVAAARLLRDQARLANAPLDLDFIKAAGNFLQAEANAKDGQTQVRLAEMLSYYADQTKAAQTQAEVASEVVRELQQEPNKNTEARLKAEISVLKADLANAPTPPQALMPEPLKIIESELEKMRDCCPENWVKASASYALTALQSYILGATPGMEWMPIETAPKDGTWIIGWPKDAEVPSSMHWAEYNDLGMQWCDAAFDGWFENVQHWVPMLPKPEVK